MASPATGPLRLLRAAGLGGASLALAAGAHAAGGAPLPGLGMLLLLALPLGLLSVGLTSRRLRLPHLLAALGLSQAGLHHALALLEPAACGGAVHAGHAVHVATQAGAYADACSPAAGGLAGMAGMLVPSLASLPMLVAHVVATVLTALLLRRGEDLLWRAVDAVLPRVPGEPVAPSAAPAPEATSPRPVPAPAWVPGRHPSRAPPAYA